MYELEKERLEFRVACEPPTEPGWYYARLLPLLKKSKTGEEPITPVQVIKQSDTLLLADPRHIDLDNFTWFGPVREIRESKTRVDSQL